MLLCMLMFDSCLLLSSSPCSRFIVYSFARWWAGILVVFSLQPLRTVLLKQVFVWTYVFTSPGRSPGVGMLGGHMVNVCVTE